MILQNFAQVTGECTVNGQPVDCGEAAEAAGGILAGLGIFMIFIFAFGLFSFVIWLLSIIHLIQHEDVENRILWIVLVLLVPLANFIYFFGFRNKREGGADQAQANMHNAPVATPGTVAPQDNNAGNSSNMAAGAVAGGAAASSGFSDQGTITPSPATTGISEPESVAENTIGQQNEDVFQPDSTQTVAQTDSAPSYPGEEPSSNIPEESTETASTPGTESYQSGSTEESALSPDSSSPQLPDDGSASSEAGSDASGSDDKSAGDSTGPSIG